MIRYLHVKLILVLCMFWGIVLSQENREISFGIHVMLGARYDNIRMCVATPARVKGGPIADIMFDTKFSINDRVALAINLPVMRPILFAAAFKMLQFEPAVTLELTHKISDDRAFILGPSIGASFHYGPDYRSDRKNKGESFFAVGPYISNLFGFQLKGSSGKNRIVGLRAFYVPLFSSKSELSPGTVLGGSLEGHFDFN